MVTDPKLPPLDTISNWIRDTRNELDITLSELGEAARISPSQLSRLENSEGNPSYEAIYRVYTELKEQQGEATVESILTSKKESHDDIQFEYVEPDDTCADVATRMDKYSISQLPVIENERAVGSVTDKTLIELEEDLESVLIQDVADPSFPEVAVTNDQETVRNLLRTNQAVLLTESPDTDITPIIGPYVGLVTAADFR
jgi:predicted transcriptional regulator